MLIQVYVNAQLYFEKIGLSIVIVVVSSQLYFLNVFTAFTFLRLIWVNRTKSGVNNIAFSTSIQVCDTRLRTYYLPIHQRRKRMVEQFTAFREDRPPVKLMTRYLLLSTGDRYAVRLRTRWLFAIDRTPLRGDVARFVGVATGSSRGAINGRLLRRSRDQA
jgi:hypothetical protein